MKKFAILCFVIMGLLISPNLVKNASAEVPKGLVEVKLRNFLGDKTSISLDVVGKYIVDSDRRTLSGTGLTIKAEAGTLNLYNGSTLVKSYGTTFSMHPVEYGTSNYVNINDRNYTGAFTFELESEKYVRPINSLLMEDYLKGVVPREMSGSWNVNALKAQTLAARTYAMRYAGSTINDTQSYQVYGGYSWFDNSNRAVNETKGEVIKYNNTLITALYSSSNGGMILSNTNTWGTGLFPYFLKKEDPYDLQSGSVNPNINWSFSLKKTQIDMSGKDMTKPELWWGQVQEADSIIMQNLKSKLIGNQIASNSDIKITNVTAVNFRTEFTSEDVLTGYVDIEYYRKKTDTNSFIKDSAGNIYKHKLRVVGESYDLRSMIGSTIMKSAYVKSVNNQSDRFTVNGGGWGHGIGMSQFGAKVMGDQGKPYTEILSFYYPNTDIVKESYNYPTVNMNAVTADVQSPQSPNTPITISADAAGGYDKVYRFWVQDGAEWKIVQDYSTKSTFTWLPKEGGDYKFSVHVKDKYSSKEYDAYDSLEYRILSAVDMKSVTADKPSPQIAGTAIKVTANAEGGNEKLYKFNLLKDGVWTVVQDYSSQNTFAWTPSVSGDYKFSVHVKDVGSSKSYDDYGVLDYKIDNKPAEPVVMQSVTTDKPSPQLTNTVINITANATGGTTKLYKFNVYDGKTWAVAQDYSAKNTYAWKPSAAGNYKVSVHVKDQSSSKSYDSYKAFEYKITAPAPSTPVKIESIVTDKLSPQPANSTIKVTANATGGNTKEYKFWVSKDGGAYVRVQDYTTNNSYNWKPTAAGNYKINVHVRDSSSSKSYDAYKVIDYVVTKDQVIVQSVTTDIASPQRINTSINVTANAVGGDSLLYKFNIFDGTKWIVLKDYSIEKTFKWVPLTSGSYKFSVHVKDTKSEKAYDAYGVKFYNITK
jgi:SpoIID/LytB domain protein